MTVKKLKPEIRFKGFENEWDERVLDDVSDLLTGFPFQSKRFVEDGIPLVRGMNVKRGFLDMSKNICEYWPSSQGFENYLLKESDFVIQMDGALIGKSYAKIQNKDLPALLVQRVTRVRCVNVNSEFIYQSIQKNFLKYILSIKTETAVPHLSLNDIRNLQITNPTIKEQTKIGTFFQNLDTLITLHQRKYDKLVTIKKAMLEKMFPKDGADVPEIRFKGFTGKWERRKIGDVAIDTYGGGTPKTSVNEYWNGNIPWIQSSDLAEEQLSNIVYRKSITEKGLKDSATKLVPANSIAIVTRVGVGKLAFMPYCYATSQDFLSLSKLKIDNWFGVYSLWKKIQSELHAVQGTSIKGITKEELLSKVIMVPFQIEEQTQIGTYFKNIDKIILLRKHELDKLKTIKKSCLEKMFV